MTAHGSEDARKGENMFIDDGSANYTAPMEISVEGPQKAEIQAKTLSDRHSKDFISYCKYTYLSTFIAVLFILARNWKWLRCLSLDEWIMKI